LLLGFSGTLLGGLGLPLGIGGSSLSIGGSLLGIGESALTLGSFSKGGQQQTLALAQVVRQEVGVVHNAYCFTDWIESRKSALKKF
jgi:hypothetical protein